MTVEPKRPHSLSPSAQPSRQSALRSAYARWPNTIGQSIGNGPTNEGHPPHVRHLPMRGNGNQYQRCGWLGTVSDGQVVEQDGVEFAMRCRLR